MATKKAVEGQTSDLKCTDNINNQNMDQTECDRSSNVVEIQTVRTELDDELDSLEANATKTKKLSVQTNYTPKLKGNKGFLIDLETNDLKPIPKTGVDELLTRFVKNVFVKQNVAETQDVRFVIVIRMIIDELILMINDLQHISCRHRNSREAHSTRLLG